MSFRTEAQSYDKNREIASINNYKKGNIYFKLLSISPFGLYCIIHIFLYSVFTGTGNVSQGAVELFRHLPHEFIDPSTLPKVAKKGRKFSFWYARIFETPSREFDWREAGNGASSPDFRDTLSRILC